MKKQGLQEEAKCVQKRAKGFKRTIQQCASIPIYPGVLPALSHLTSLKMLWETNIPMSPVPLVGADWLFQKLQCTETSIPWQTGAVWCATWYLTTGV